MLVVLKMKWAILQSLCVYWCNFVHMQIREMHFCTNIGNLSNLVHFNLNLISSWKLNMKEDFQVKVEQGLNRLNFQMLLRYILYIMIWYCIILTTFSWWGCFHFNPLYTSYKSTSPRSDQWIVIPLLVI